ncbi:MAG: hypothetical protein WDN08_22050 [Rhizomicrobium sp.]
MARLVEDVVDRAGFDDVALAHHRDAVGDAGDHSHVVADQDDGGLQLDLQVAHDLQDLRLHRDVERGGRLVGDQEVGTAHRRHRDHDALAHAAGELVRILLHPALGLGDAHQFEHLDGALLGLVARRLEWRARPR